MVICIFLLGTRFLKIQFIKSKKREAFFIFAMLSSLFGILLYIFIVLYKKHDCFSSFLFLYKERHWHWANSFLSPIAFILFEITVDCCFLANFIFLISTFYVCSYSIQFWLQKLWYVLVCIINNA